MLWPAGRRLPALRPPAQIPLKTVYEAIALGRRRGVPVLLNPAPARDTTGAGDAFIGCFSHHLVQTGDVERCLELAMRYSADSVTKRGTQVSFATAAEFEAVLPIGSAPARNTTGPTAGSRCSSPI